MTKIELTLYKGNTVLLENLMEMVFQFFLLTEDNEEILSHRYISAEENAIDTLIKAGMAIELRPNKYKLNWDALDIRKEELVALAKLQEHINETSDEPSNPS